MWWSDRRGALGLIAAAPTLAACGFRPAAGPGSPAADLAGAVRMAAPDDRDSFDLVARLEDRLGRPGAPRYRLDYSIETSRRTAGVTAAQEVTRYSISGTARYTLTEIGAEAPLAQGEVTSFTSYSAAGSTLSTATAREDARRRLMVILADRIVTRLTGELAAEGAG